MATKRRIRRIMRRKSVKGGGFFTNKVNPITTDTPPNTTFGEYLPTGLYKTDPCFTTQVTPNNKFCVKNVNINDNGIYEINGIYDNASSDSTIQITPTQLDTKITIYQKGGKSTKKRRIRKTK